VSGVIGLLFLTLKLYLTRRATRNLQNLLAGEEKARDIAMAVQQALGKHIISDAPVMGDKEHIEMSIVATP
jgi:hypothetical protein